MRFYSVVAALGGLAIAGLALSGCTDSDWDHALTYGGLGEQTVAAEPVPPPAPAPATAPAPASESNASFCESVAKQAATRDGFDAATQQRMFQRSFQQCVAMFGTATAAR
jgi:hypothetical protein